LSQSLVSMIVEMGTDTPDVVYVQRSCFGFGRSNIIIGVG